MLFLLLNFVTMLNLCFAEFRNESISQMREVINQLYANEPKRNRKIRVE